jgi:nitrate reductase NapE
MTDSGHRKNLRPNNVKANPRGRMMQEPQPTTPLSEAVTPESTTTTRRKEWRLFVFIIVFLFPLLTFALVAAMGFSIWMYQLLMGPPGAG